MKILITGSNGQLGNELQKIVSTGKAEIGAVSEEIKNAEVLLSEQDKNQKTFKELDLPFVYK